jgi:hypothetical protein
MSAQDALIADALRRAARLYALLAEAGALPEIQALAVLVHNDVVTLGEALADRGTKAAERMRTDAAEIIEASVYSIPDAGARAQISAAIRALEVP